MWARGLKQNRRRDDACIVSTANIHFRSGTLKKTGGNETIHCRLYKQP